MEKLDAFLRKLTESELKYKKGYRNHSWDQYEKIETKTGKILKITEPEVFNTNLQNAPILDVKKHSRFQDCPMHFHDFIEVNYMYSGNCIQTINGELHQMKEGQILLIDSDTIHTINKLGENDILINLFINKDSLDRYFVNQLSTNNIIIQFFVNSIIDNTNHDNFIFFHSENSKRLSTFINELLYEYYFPSTNSLEILNNLFSLLMSELVNVREKDIFNETDLYKNTPFIEILRYIEKHFNYCTLQSVAKKFNVNPNYLSEIIKQNTGYSFQELVHIKKFKTVELLLKTSKLTIEEIANYVGYTNLSFFYRKFKNIYGCTPNDFRIKG